MCSSRKTRLICGIIVPALSAFVLAGCLKEEETPESQEDTSLDVSALFDPDFARALESKGYIKDADNITADEVSAITEINVDDFDLESLRGIEYFTALTSLSCFSNNLASLDVSNNKALKELWCEINDLTSLDLSKNTALTLLSCSDNPGNMGKFTVTAWFGSDAIPEGFTTGTWDLISGQTVVIEYVKAEMKIENAYKL